MTADPSPSELESYLDRVHGFAWTAWAGTNGRTVAARSSADGELTGLLLLSPGALDEDLAELLPPLRRAGVQLTEAFLRLVAVHYRVWGALTGFPGRDLAAGAGVGRTLMHSWVTEARSRGYLPPARLRPAPSRVPPPSHDPAVVTAGLPPLKRAGRTPAEFAELVAAHHRAWSAVSRQPAVDMARASGVRVWTVRSWIRDARIHGALPMGRAGGGQEAGQ